MDFIKKRSFFLFLFALIIISFYSVGPSIGFYFYADDYVPLYRIQQDEYLNGWPYTYINLFFIPIYYIFRIHAEAYFGFGILTHFIAALFVYLFVKVLTKNKLVSVLSSLIFATGYIGVSHFGMIISSINNINIINICITMILYLLWIDKRKIRYYLAALILLWFSLISITVRAYPLILFLLTLEVVLSLSKGGLKMQLKKIILQIISFVPIFFIGYYSGIFSFLKSSGNVSKDSMSIVKTIANIGLDDISLQMPVKIIEALGRFVIIEPVSSSIWKYPHKPPYLIAGFIFLAFIAFIIFYKKKTVEMRFRKSLLILLLLSIEGFLGLLIITPIAAENATSRYLTISLLGFSGIFPTIFYILLSESRLRFRKRYVGHICIILTLPIIVLYAQSSRVYLSKIADSQGFYAKKFFKQLKSYIPSVSGNNLFYFETAEYFPVSSRFGSIIIGALMPEEVTLATFYKVPINTVKISHNIYDTLDYLKNNSIKPNNLHSFYYDENGLVDTTKKIESLLKHSEKIYIIKQQASNTNSGSNIDFSNLNIPSYIPMDLKVTMKISPLGLDAFTLPFFNKVSDSPIEKEKIISLYKEHNTSRQNIFDYLSARKQYYKRVTYKVSSEDINYKKENLFDDRIDSAWLSDQSAWDIKIKTWVKVDLGEAKEINRFVWYRSNDRVPGDYQISVSLDGLDWQKIYQHKGDEKLNESHFIVDEFNPVSARFVKLEIDKTNDNMPPAISEIEVVESKFKDVNIEDAIRIKNNPFEYVQNEKEVTDTYNYLAQNSYIYIFSKTNKDENIENKYSLKVPIIIDDNFHDYDIPLYARGTRIEELVFKLDFPAKIEIKNLSVVHKKFIL
ncbi:MAG: discoidin domain-containing protein [Candidatus Levybacteria bacterium]|nr:discoidin domain-containing protein [Candidatus Levybacteria bacterium]